MAHTVTHVQVRRTFAVDIGSIESSTKTNTGLSLRSEEASFPFGLNYNGEFMTSEDVRVVLPNAIFEVLSSANTRTMTLPEYIEFYQTHKTLTVDETLVQVDEFMFEELFPPGLVMELCTDLLSIPMAREFAVSPNKLTDIYKDLLDTTTVGFVANTVALVFLVKEGDRVFAVPIMYRVKRSPTMTLGDALTNGLSKHKTVIYNSTAHPSFYALLHAALHKEKMAAMGAARFGAVNLALACERRDHPYTKQEADIMLKMFLMALIPERGEDDPMHKVNKLNPSLRTISYLNQPQFESFLAQIKCRPQVGMFGEDLSVKSHQLTPTQLAFQMNEFVNYGRRNVASYYQSVNPVDPENTKMTIGNFLWFPWDSLLLSEQNEVDAVVRVSRAVWFTGFATSVSRVEDLLSRMHPLRLMYATRVEQAHAIDVEKAKVLLKRPAQQLASPESKRPKTVMLRKRPLNEETGNAALSLAKREFVEVEEESENAALSPGKREFVNVAEEAQQEPSPTKVRKLVAGPGDHEESEPVDCNVQ